MPNMKASHNVLDTLSTGTYNNPSSYHLGGGTSAQQQQENQHAQQPIPGGLSRER